MNFGHKVRDQLVSLPAFKRANLPPFPFFFFLPQPPSVWVLTSLLLFTDKALDRLRFFLLYSYSPLNTASLP